MNDCSGNLTHSIGRGGLRSLVGAYIAMHRPGALREKSFFESMPSLELAIQHAAFALDDREPPKRYSHQRRIRMRPMKQAHHFLLQSRERLAKVRSFEELHEFLRIAFSSIHGVGALYTYDTALRLGFFLKLAPEKVYLHAGTRQGARALGVRNADFVEVSSLPKELAALPPHEIENFLCIFKSRAEG